MSNPQDDVGAIHGERSTISLVQRKSLQSRSNAILITALAAAIGIGSMAWFYSQAYQRPAVVRHGTAPRPAEPSPGDAPLPSIGRVSPPIVLQTEQPSTGSNAQPNSAVVEAGVPVEASQSVHPGTNIEFLPPATMQTQSIAPLSGAARRLAGPVFSAQSIVPSMTPSSPQSPGTPESLPNPSSGPIEPVRAHLLPTTRLLLPKGAFIDCTLETAVDSTLPGMTTCVTATDTFGVDGDVVLLERGTKLVGEIKGEVSQGAARLFVVWNEARTPAGVLVPLESPGTDELGRAGMAGTVNRHFWQRFGAAMLVSIVDGAVQAGVESANRGGAAVVVSPAATQGVATEVLKSTVNIPPTVVKQQGDRIQVIVARDLDFRSVYALRATAGAR